MNSFAAEVFEELPYKFLKESLEKFFEPSLEKPQEKPQEKIHFINEKLFENPLG